MTLRKAQTVSMRGVHALLASVSPIARTNAFANSLMTIFASL
jgi:hypothetical protein